MSNWTGILLPMSTSSSSIFAGNVNLGDVPLSDMSNANGSSLAMAPVSSQTLVASGPTRVKGLESAILRSYKDVIHPLHEHAGIVNNLRLPWLTHYRTYVEEYQDCVDHSAQLAYGELALLNYLIDTDPIEGFDSQVRSFVLDMRAEIVTFVDKLRALQASSSQLWSTISLNDDEQDLIQAAIDQLKAHISRFPADKQRLAEGVEAAIRCQPDFAMTIDKILVHWNACRLFFSSRLDTTNVMLSNTFIRQDRNQRTSTQEYITAIHSTIQVHGIYFVKTNDFVKNLSFRAVSNFQKESIPLPSFCKTQFMETIGAPIFAHAAQQLKHLKKLMGVKVLAELVSVKYLSGGKYHISIAVDVSSEPLSQAAGDECRCKSLQVVLHFNHANHRSGSQLFRPQVVDCEPRTGKFNAEEIKSTSSSQTAGRIPLLTFVEGYRDKKEEYTTRHGININTSKYDVNDGGVASDVKWIINEDTFRDFKYDGIPGIPLSVDLHCDESHQVLITVEIKATFALRVKVLPWVYIPATRVMEVTQVDRFVNLAVWAVKECNGEAQKKEEGTLKLNVVGDSLQYTEPSES